MIKEIFSKRENSTELNIVDGKIDAVVRKDHTMTGYRVYDQGRLGIVGVIGKHDPESLIKQAAAEAKWGNQVSWSPVSGHKRRVEQMGTFLSVEDFAGFWEDKLKVIRSEFSDFVISNKLVQQEIVETLVNDNQTDLSQRVGYNEHLLILKDKGSQDIFSTFGGTVGYDFDFDAFMGVLDQMVSGYRRPVDLPKEDVLPVIMMSPDILHKFFTKQLSADVFQAGGSLFNGKAGQQIFSPNMSLEIKRDPSTGIFRFFDMEGVSPTEETKFLIHKGVLKRPISDLKHAHLYGYDANGGAAGVYDGSPNAQCTDIGCAKTHETMDDLLGGRMAVFAVIAAGGDFSDEGNFASPVQLSYLYQDGKIIGKLPPVKISASIFDMYGKGYHGEATLPLGISDAFTVPVMDMKVETI